MSIADRNAEERWKLFREMVTAIETVAPGDHAKVLLTFSYMLNRMVAKNENDLFEAS